jgi:hypothetical protein
MQQVNNFFFFTKLPSVNGLEHLTVKLGMSKLTQNKKKNKNIFYKHFIQISVPELDKLLFAFGILHNVQFQMLCQVVLFWHAYTLLIFHAYDTASVL